MKVSFRHGILRYQTDIANTPTFLRKSSMTGDFIDLIVSPDPTVFTISHGNTNYLIEEGRTIQNAWGPLVAHGQTQYLYWDVSLLDAALTRGYTLLPVYVTASEPLTPAIDQHWFDISAKCMKVWNGNKWLIKLRVFAATYSSSAIIVPMPRGTQGGLPEECEAGNILLAKNNKPLRNVDGELITTESGLFVSRASSEEVRFDTAVNHAQATEYIPKFSLVSIIGPRKVALASHLNITRQVSGLVMEDLYLDEVGRIHSGGLIRNEQWSFPSSVIGDPVFCGPTGEVTTVPPTVGISQPVGEVQDVDAIYLNIQNAVIL